MPDAHKGNNMSFLLCLRVHTSNAIDLFLKTEIETGLVCGFTKMRNFILDRNAKKSLRLTRREGFLSSKPKL
jgi:hypothetical protein